MAADGRADTRTACPVDGVDQPSTAGPTAAPPSSTGTKINIACYPVSRRSLAQIGAYLLGAKMKLYSWFQACGAHPRVRCVHRTLVRYAPGTHA